MTTEKSIVNIAGYKFVELSDLEACRDDLRQRCEAQQLLGSILIAHEGINFNLAGTAAQTEAFLADLPAEFAGIPIKRSLSVAAPFKRLLLKIKPEIIRMGVPHIRAEQQSAPRLTPNELHRWYAEHKEFVILDTRNQFEYELGSFERAVPLHIDKFSEFPAAVRQLPAELKAKPVVTFCTGGVRCEKAALLMQEYGFEEVYQLDGGILNYFEQHGGDYWQGECFVFDQRIQLDPELNEPEATELGAQQN